MAADPVPVASPAPVESGSPGAAQVESGSPGTAPVASAHGSPGAGSPGSVAAALRARESAVIRRVQAAVATPPVVRAARGLSHFGEHAAGWLAIGAVAALVDRRRRADWVAATAGVVAAHAASVAIKRVVRRKRPDDAGVRILVPTPSRLSFPSAHATSTTAAAVLYGSVVGAPLVPVVVPPMLASRVVLGVHFPTDVLTGAALGATVGRAVLTYRRRRSAR